MAQNERWLNSGVLFAEDLGRYNDDFEYTGTNVEELYIPAKSSTEDAIGNTLTNPPNKVHNNSETKLITTSTDNKHKISKLFFDEDQTAKEVSYGDIITSNDEFTDITVNDGMIDEISIQGTTRGVDANGNEITNTPVTLKAFHNNSEAKIIPATVNPLLLANPFWSTDGINYDPKSFGDIDLNANYINNVIGKVSMDETTFRYINRLLTYSVGKTWEITEVSYNNEFVGDDEPIAGTSDPT